MIYKHWVAKFVKAFKLREESGISWSGETGAMTEQEEKECTKYLYRDEWF